MDKFEAVHKRVMARKWKAQEKLGLTKPKSSDENRRRLREARGEYNG